MKKILKELVPYIVIILTVVLIRSFVITPVQVRGSSMYPTLKNREILILKKYDKSFKRFDIIVLKYRKDKLIKRIIGLPGESIEVKDNKLYINEKKIKQKFKTNTKTSDFNLEDLYNTKKIPENTYFVMGDNRNNSTDSRIIGFINKEDIEGVVGIRIFPINHLGKIK